MPIKKNTSPRVETAPEMEDAGSIVYIYIYTGYTSPNLIRSGCFSNLKIKHRCFSNLDTEISGLVSGFRCWAFRADESI